MLFVFGMCIGAITGVASAAYAARRNWSLMRSLLLCLGLWAVVDVPLIVLVAHYV